MNKCKQCGKDIEVVPGKVQRQFCNDAHRKAYKRAELKEFEVIASPSVDEPRTDDTKLPTPDSNRGQPTSDKGVTVINERSNEPPLLHKPVAPKKYALHVIPKPERTTQGNIRVSKPGDDDYVPMCETTRAFIDGRDKRPETGKRGKDIKCFADLPPDVQQTIDSLSMVDGKICKTVKANRTAIAINYQHLFSDRFHSTGVSV